VEPRYLRGSPGAWAVGASLVLVLALAIAPALAETPDAGARDEGAAPPVLPLPRFREPPTPKAERADQDRLTRLLDQLSSEDSKLRFEARSRVQEVDVSWLAALLERFERLADTANKPALKAELERVRDRARANLREALESEGKGKSGDVVTPDYLDMLVSHPDRSSSDLRPLTEVVALSRMFERVGTLPAARGVVDVYVRFGEFLRVDTQLALDRMKDRAIAALIEATAHPVPRIAAWAKKQLEDMGKAVASEAMQVLDPTLRADILRAYGKTRDLETARLLISYAASERAQIRLAAREAVAMLGEAGLWQLRDAYEKTVGQRAERQWPWDRVARELFAQFDRQRLSEIYALWQRGRDAEARGDLEGARVLFDKVLAWDPTFERGAAMAPTYLAFAERQADADPEAAELAARRAERLAAPGPVRDSASSLRLTLEGRALYERGVVDEVLLQRARELDKDNRRASALEEKVRANAAKDQSEWRRYLAASVILVLGGAGVAFIAGRRRQGAEESRGPGR
jgi:hypothetical protein